jgi:predicted DNA-binding transcriptional regulator AlpA
VKSQAHNGARAKASNAIGHNATGNHASGSDAPRTCQSRDAAGTAASLIDEIHALRRELREAQTPTLLIDVDELARLLSVDERTLRRLRASHEIPRPVALSGHPKWRRADIEAFVGKMRLSR